MNEGEGGAREDFEPEDRLFSYRLKRGGYRVGYFGKWHCGNVRIAEDHDFEDFSMTGYGYPYWTDEYAAYLEEFESKILRFQSLYQTTAEPSDWEFTREDLKRVLAKLSAQQREHKMAA